MSIVLGNQVVYWTPIMNQSYSRPSGLFHWILIRIFWKGITLTLRLRFWDSEKLSHIILSEYKSSFSNGTLFPFPLRDERKGWLKLEPQLEAKFQKKSELNTENFLGIIKSIWPLHLNIHTQNSKEGKEVLGSPGHSPPFIASVTASSDDYGSLVYVMNQDKKVGHMLRS